MYFVRDTDSRSLPDVAACHKACFPNSLSTKLGEGYVSKSLEWFLVHPNRFLYHIEDGGRVVGYCGGFMPAKKGDGSSSGMLQHAFSKAVRGILFKPWLAVHPEVRQHYPFIWRNIKRRTTGRLQPAPEGKTVKPFQPFVGLVVIGVHPGHRGKGVAQLLMTEFESRVKQLKQHDLMLSVKKDNVRAIKAYQNFGWHIHEEQAKTYVMKKTITYAS